MTWTVGKLATLAARPQGRQSGNLPEIR